MGRVVGLDLIVKARVDAVDRRHGGVDIVHEVGAAFGDGEVVVARAHVEHGGGAGRGDRVVHDGGVDLVVCQRRKEVATTGHFFIGAGDALAGKPLLADDRLHDAGVAADGKALECLRIALGKIVAIGLGVDVVALGAFGVGGEEQLLRALLGVRDVGHEVDFARLEHIHELGEGAGDIFVLPAGGVVREGLEILVAPAREALARVAVLEPLVVDKPADAHRFDLLIGLSGKGRCGHDGTQHGKRGEHDGEGAIYS